MNAHAFIILLFIKNGICFNSYNVGTVLFSQSDLSKTSWSKREMQLLQARFYFQEAIASPDPEEYVDDEYLNDFLNYVQTIFKEVDSLEIQKNEKATLQIALSDVIGGFIKTWVIPATKFSFYSGTVAQDNAFKLLRIFGNLIEDLRTDGEGWKSPDKSILSDLKVERTPVTKLADIGSFACEDIVYFESTDSSMRLPTPIVYWNKDLSTMFLPIKNHSLIPLSSKSDDLLRYYRTALACLQKTDPNDAQDFGKRFQKWFNSDVIPHLSDSCLYIALGGCLSLLNSTEDDYKSIRNMMVLNKKPSRFNGFLCYIRAKKYLIVTILILLEVAWCIPAIICLKWSRKRKLAQSNSENKDTDCLFFYEGGKKSTDSKDNFSSNPTSSVFKNTTSFYSSENTNITDKNSLITPIRKFSSNKQLKRENSRKVRITDNLKETKKVKSNKSFKKLSSNKSITETKCNLIANGAENIQNEERTEQLEEIVIVPTTRKSRPETILRHFNDSAVNIGKVYECPLVPYTNRYDATIALRDSCILNLNAVDSTNKVDSNSCSPTNTIYSVISSLTALEYQDSNYTLTFQETSSSRNLLNNINNFDIAITECYENTNTISEKESKTLSSLTSNTFVKSKDNFKKSKVSIDHASENPLPLLVTENTSTCTDLGVDKPKERKTRVTKVLSTSSVEISVEQPETGINLSIQRYVGKSRGSKIPKPVADAKVGNPKPSVLSATTSPIQRSRIPKLRKTCDDMVFLVKKKNSSSNRLNVTL